MTIEEIIQTAEEQGTQSSVLVGELAKVVKGDGESEELDAIIQMAKEQGTQSSVLVGELAKVVKGDSESEELDAIIQMAKEQGTQSSVLVGELAKVVKGSDEIDYLCFTAEEDGAKMSIIGMRSADKAFDLPDFKYSTDKVNWVQLEFTEGEEEEGTIPFSGQIFTLGLGEKVYFKGLNPNGYSQYVPDTDSRVHWGFSISEGAIAASGDIGTTTDEIGGANCTLTEGCYAGIFAECISLTTAPSLPATTLARGCYEAMFSSCESLVVAPSLPATTLTDNCYGAMFAACTSLTTAPELPATILAEECYVQMFCYCTSLTTAPELPATELAQQCYGGMFHSCTSLTTAPSLPATTLAESCYSNMFNNCTSLTAAPSLPATILAIECYEDMFEDCTFTMSDDGTTFNFDFGATLPQTVDEVTLSTHKDVATWMDNTTGFNE